MGKSAVHAVNADRDPQFLASLKLTQAAPQGARQHRGVTSPTSIGNLFSRDYSPVLTRSSRAPPSCRGVGMTENWPCTCVGDFYLG